MTTNRNNGRSNAVGPRVLLLAGAATAALIAPPARAQTASAKPAASSDVSEIVVTARRRSESVLRVPYNISAISGGAIESRSLSNPNELLRTVPGVSVVDRGPRNAGQLDGARIRGINVDSAALGDYAVSSVSPLSTYINDTPVFANFLLKDLDRVEVLRGPQATLYGSGSLGGTVRYIQNEPSTAGFSGKFTSTQSYTANSDGAGWNGDLTVNVPLSNTAAVRATVSRLYDPGFIDYPNLYKPGPDGLQPTLNGAPAPTPSDFYRANSVNDQRTWYAHASILWRPTADLKLVANYTYQDDHVGGRQSITEGTDGFGNVYGRYDNGAVIKEPSSRKVNVESLEATYDLGFATLTSSTSYYDHRGDSVTDNTGFYGHLLPGLPVGFLYYFTYYAPNRLPLTTFVNTYSERAVVEEARLSSNPKPGVPFDYVIGIFYEDQDRGAGSRNYLPGFQETYLAGGGDPSFVSGDRSFYYQRADHYRDVAGFGELTWHATSRLDVTGGMRYFSNASDVNATIGGGVLTRNNIYATSATHVSENRPLGKGNIAYHLDEDNLVYATVAQGYRRGGSNAIPITGPQREDPSYLNYASDSTLNYEFGVKGRSHGIVYTLAAFYIDWTNVQVNIQTPYFGYYAVVNGKSATSKGFEAELRGKLIPSVGWSLGYAYTDAHLTSDIITAPEVINPGGAPFVAGHNGASLPGVPSSTLNVGLDHTAQLGDKFTLVSRISGYYQSSTQNGVTPGVQAATLSPFWLWTISSSLQWQRYEATLFVKNLFNAKAITGVYTPAFSGTDLAANFYGNDSRDQIATPTTVGLALSYRF